MARAPCRVTVRVPGSIANVGPGFDVFSLALEKPYDVVTAELTDEEGVSIEVTGVGSETVPTDPDENTAGLVTLVLKDRYGFTHGVKLTIEKGIRPGYGMGSSGADAAAAAYVLNHLLSLGLTGNELVEVAARGEVAASNAAHADNVSASLLGGFTVVSSYDPMHVLSCRPPEDLGICIATPRIETPPKKTALARSAIPERVSIEQLTHNVGHASALLYGVLMGNIAVMGRAMSDSVVEPVRSKMIPGYDRVRESALRGGAVGVAICGAGPSIAAFYDSKTTRPEPILKEMAEGFEAIGIESDQIATNPGSGVKVLHGYQLGAWATLANNKMVMNTGGSGD